MLSQMALHLDSSDALLSVFVLFCLHDCVCAYQPEGGTGGWGDIERGVKDDRRSMLP